MDTREKDIEKLKDYKGGGTLDLMTAVYGDKYSRKELKIMTDDKEIIFREIYKNNVVPIMGFMEMFELIKSKEILVGIASNAIRKNVKMILSELKIYGKFDSIICGDEVKKGKPDPEMFNETVDRFNLKKEECLIFEDSIEGVTAAVNSNVALAVSNPPAALKKSTLRIGLVIAPVESVPITASALPSSVLEPVGNVAPEAAIAIAPVPSEEIVAPSKLIELEERNISFHLLSALPKL